MVKTFKLLLDFNSVLKQISNTEDQFKTKSSEMKVLKLVKFHLKLIGCLELQNLPSYNGFSVTSILRFCVIFSLLFSISTTFWFFIFEANEFKEFSESFVYGITHSIMLIWYLLFLRKRKAFERFLCNLEKKVLTSK